MKSCRILLSTMAYALVSTPLPNIKVKIVYIFVVSFFCSIYGVIYYSFEVPGTKFTTYCRSSGSIYTHTHKDTHIFV